MNIIFVYRYTWSGEPRAYFVTHADGATTVRHFDGEPGAVVSSVPAGRMAEIQAHIDSIVESLASPGAEP